MYRIDKTSLLLIVEIWRFNATNGVQDKREHRVNTFMSYSQMLKMSSTSLHILFRLLSKTRDSFIPEENFPLFSPVRLLIQKLYLSSDEAFKNLRVLLPRHDVCRAPN